MAKVWILTLYDWSKTLETMVFSSEQLAKKKIVRIHEISPSINWGIIDRELDSTWSLI
jgi:hypothetical protein